MTRGTNASGSFSSRWSGLSSWARCVRVSNWADGWKLQTILDLHGSSQNLKIFEVWSETQVKRKTVKNDKTCDIYIYKIYSSFWDVFSDLLRCLAKLCCVNCVQVTDPHHTSVQWLQHFPQRLGRLCHGDGWMCHWRQCQALAIPRPSQRLPTSSEL